MRLTLFLAFLIATSGVMGSDPPNPSWAPEWDMHLREGTCWLTKSHGSYRVPRNGPYYDDFKIRIAVAVMTRNQTAHVAPEHIGRPRIHIYTSRPRGEEGRKALRIDGATLQGRLLLRQEGQAAQNLHPDYRFLLMSYEDSAAAVVDFLQVPLGSRLDLQLTLSDGQLIDLKLPVGRYFSTWHKMLEVCMMPDTAH